MSITLNTKVYTFSGFVQGISRYLNRDNGSPRGFLQLSAAVEGGTGENPYKVRWKLKLPVTATSSDAFADIVVTLPSNSTAAERTAMAESLADLTANAQFAASVESLTVPSS
jgi:hypothetical protein